MSNTSFSCSSEILAHFSLVDRIGEGRSLYMFGCLSVAVTDETKENKVELHRKPYFLLNLSAFFKSTTLASETRK
jgi:hypothetical protein